ncbi:MAG: hypothetical protein COW00_02535 [Bdellovibrio sp. CG12_big_fil_rev_8_21_14_0_65_39_13]|nr:MAG: hypothetical protein COW78_03580 [Bdellovibrio sp. CG22_combo_CG10-13_8_21_14_all_39_27]PIQ62015.1 MAG: hypothetical protein COW00_02535 [Bdellovibrio sp. CG12_big_fil_rev_8_21_14_0_65_39_13]PIR34117.1 MAG: hypothetical protein COV37_14310 [Bdellovibrio sp. CG11_big_fil_rev_8_21_14_0_20_39_38]
MKLLCSTVLFFTLIQSSVATVVLNDKDLSTLDLKEIRSVAPQLSPDRIELSDHPTRGTSIQSFLSKNGQLQKIVELPFAENINCNGSSITLNAELRKDGYFQIKSRKNYFVHAQVTCGKINKLIFESASDAGQAIGIWNIASLALQKFLQINRDAFWKKSITINWPASGDYYSFNTVNITRGDYWDVVGHELGHAIYDQANIGSFGGGSHKIDECYSQALALSEGWASFFSAWISIDLNDPDAKFEFMVPRRAPLRIETIPSDVCPGEKNEWRVTGFFWDLIDLHQDDEDLNESFQLLWDKTLNKKAKTTNEIAANLISLGLPQAHINEAWELNFLITR